MKRLPLAIAVFLVGLSGCSVSSDQEAQMGEQTAREVEAQLPIVDDPYLTSYINELGDTIASHTSRADLQWHFYIVNSHQVNAFALPGGYVYVNRGLIESADRADELAGAMGHEIGHVILRHSVKQMGEQTAREVEAQLPIVDDPYLTSYINELGDTIASHTSRANLRWHFYIVNSHQVNAFALPGGYVYVNRGLIESADRADELAGAMGHEIGHVILRHSVKQMQQQEKLGVVASLACTLTNICNNGVARAAINIGGTALISRYSRTDELEADSEAVENVLHVNIDPEGIPALFEVLMKQRQTQPSIVEGWFSTHPLEESRIQQARRLIAKKGADHVAGLMQDLPSYAEFRKRVAALPEPPQAPPSGPSQQ